VDTSVNDPKETNFEERGYRLEVLNSRVIVNIYAEMDPLALKRT